MLCYCIQIEFTSLVRIKTLCLLYLLSVVLGSLLLFGFVFPREFSSVSGVTWSVRAPSGNLCCVTSPGKLSSALLCSRLLRGCYGIGTVLDFINGWFQGESPADRRALEGAASRSFRDVQAMFKRVRESG